MRAGSRITLVVMQVVVGACLWPAASFAADWTGFYLGANAGFGVGLSAGTRIALDGSTVGAQAGFLRQLPSGLVFGAQLDGQWENQGGTELPIDQGLTVLQLTADEENDAVGGTIARSTTDTLNWSGALVGRVGYAWGNLLPYAVGGVAAASNTVANSVDGFGVSYSSADTHIHVGYVAGIGIEERLGDNLSAFLELRRADYGLQNYTEATQFGTETYPISFVDNSVRVGLNLHLP